MDNPKTAYEMFPLGLQLSHRAILRNLDHFAQLTRVGRGLAMDRAERRETMKPERAAEYITWFDDFLDVHHQGEDHHIFPALRSHSAGRSTDIAHLDAWAREHEQIYRLSGALRNASRKLASDPNTLGEVQRLAAELRQTLEPHLRAEEEVLTPQHLREMIPEKELERAQLAIPKSQGVSAVRMAQFFVHSLEPGEQRALLGDTPWFFRKIVLGAFGAARARRLGELMPVRELYV
jgi:hemerythrin-like domain-containing protein